MLASQPDRPIEGRRIVICDYNLLLQSVTGLLRMNGYTVFQAYDADAARELCAQLENIEMLILNTTGTGTDSATLVQDIRRDAPEMPVLHIGNVQLAGMPDDVPTLAESFTSDLLLSTVADLLARPGTVVDSEDVRQGRARGKGGRAAAKRNATSRVGGAEADGGANPFGRTSRQG